MRRLIGFLLLAISTPSLAEYRVIPYGTQYTFEFVLRDANATALVSGLTLEVGDCKVSEDGSADSNCDTLPTAIASTNKYLFTISAAEATGARIAYALADADSTDYFAREFTFDTCGNLLARYASCSAQQEGDVQLSTTVSAVQSSTQIDLANSFADDRYNDRLVCVTDADDGNGKDCEWITESTDANNRITLEKPLDFAVETGDAVVILTQLREFQ